MSSDSHPPPSPPRQTAILALFFAVSLAAVFAAAFLAAHWASPPPSHRKVIAKIMPSVVNISGKTNEHSAQLGGRHSGAGVIVDPDGHILTNYHVIANIARIETRLFNGDAHIAQVAGIDPEIDLAVLTVAAAELPAIRFAADHQKLRAGDIVFAVGNPLGLGRSATMGIVSAIGRGRLGLNRVEHFIQTDAAINPGNSGGALANLSGELVGINSAFSSRYLGGVPQGIGFAIPADIARRSYLSLMHNPPPEDNQLGARVRALSPRLRDEILEIPRHLPVVLLVCLLRPDSAADTMGLQVGDIILQIDGNEIIDAPPFLPPDLSQLLVLRHGEELLLPR